MANPGCLRAPYRQVAPGTGGADGAEAPPREQLPLARASPFHDELPVDWVLGYDISGRRDALVPRACVLLDAAAGRAGSHRVPRLFQTGSSGLAAGNTMAEAVCHGLYELVERDAQAIDAASRTGPAGLFAGPPVSLAEVRSPALCHLAGLLRAAGHLLFVHDLTTDLRIPAFGAALADGTEPGRGVGIGFGAHLDPALAVQRAVLEAAQACTVVAAGSRDDLLTAQYRRARWSHTPGRLARHEAEVHAHPPVPLPPSAATPGLGGDLRELLGRLRAAGYPRVVVTDLRVDGMDLDVVRVIVPGLEGYTDFDCYAPGPRARSAGAAARPGCTHGTRPPAGRSARPGLRRVPRLHWHGPLPDSAKQAVAGVPRAAPLGATLERCWTAARAAGVTRVADITGLDRVGIPVVLAIRPSSAWLAVDAGKGTSAPAARVSALMESIERHSAQMWRPEPFVACHADLVRGGSVPPWQSLPFAGASAAHPEAEERWVRGWDLAGGRPLDLPFCMVGYDAGRSHGTDAVGFQPGSNGLAAASDLAEAACGALYELVERDAIACWEARTAGRAPGPRVALGTVPYALPCELAERFRQAGVEPLVFDCTSDLGVPVFAASLVDLRRPGAPLAGGYGCHLDPEVALTRALTEAAQSRAVDIAGSRDDLPAVALRRLGACLDPARSRALLDLPEVPGAGAHRDAATPTFGGDIEVLIGRLGEAGLKHVAVYDLTAESLRIPAVRVAVPGLEGYPHSAAYHPGPRARAAAGGAAGRPG
jgi:ribosomal protein S12 methylthiotransferase accessory factor